MDEIRNERDPIRKAQYIKKLHDEESVSYNHIAEELAVSPTYVSNYLRLLRLPMLVLDGYYTGSISLTHLFILARIKDQEQVIALYEQILERNMSARDVEEAVRNILHHILSDGAAVENAVIDTLQRKFQQYAEEAKVKVIQTRIKAKLVVELKGNRVKTSAFLRRLSEE